MTQTTADAVASLPPYATRLRDALAAEFGGRAEAEATGTADRCRFVVVSERFGAMDDFEAQDAVWDLAERVLDRRELAAITLIYTYTPEEFSPRDPS